MSISRFNLRRRFGITLAAGALAACSAEAPSELGKTQQATKTYDLDVRRSLVVTERPILERFSLERVMDRLVAQSGITGLTATQLFNDWWATQNPAPDPPDSITHCDDPELLERLNGFPYDCRPEGFQASCDPFAPGSPCEYVPIGLFNRFDQAPEDGSHCGEYRIVYALASGLDPAVADDRNLVIFEASMPNPTPPQGLKGCRKIVDVWAQLTAEDDIEDRADALERFYFEGHGNVPPVISVTRFGDNSLALGQVRTNQFYLPQTGWQLREFQLFETCAGTSCTLRFEPVTNKVNPFGPLFDPMSAEPAAADFRAFFPAQVASLAAADLTGIRMEVPDEFNTGRSISSTAFDEMKYLDQLGDEPSDLRDAIAIELTALGSTLTVDDIVLRAQAMSCAGCHRLSRSQSLGAGLVWPEPSGFVHVDERSIEVVDGVERFLLSPALIDVFLPHRKQVMEDFLENKPRVPKGPGNPIGGFRGHG